VSVLFIDESKSKKYWIVAVEIEENSLPKLRQRLRNLVLPGQRSIHFQKESDRRKRQLLTEFSKFEFRVIVVQSPLADNLSARRDCLSRLLVRLPETDVSRVVLERDDSILNFDKQIFRDYQSSTGAIFGYQMAYRHEEPLLWLPDAIAWCIQRGGAWRSEADHLFDSSQL
jgi:hypothetical protein